MKKLMFLFVLLVVFTAGCSRTFVVTTAEKPETNHFVVDGYADQGITVKSTSNWTLGKTSGINSHVYLDNKNKADRNADDLSNLEPDLIVNFDFNSVSLLPVYAAKLENVFSDLKNVDSIELVGHTDNIGSEKVNLDLSNKRALAVKKFILENNSLPIRILGKGLKSPIATNETEKGRQLNRRVEVYLK